MFALLAGLVIAQCGDACPILDPMDPRVIEATMAAHIAIVEVYSERTGSLIHRASGALTFGEKVHLGGKDLRRLGFDAPDYEVNSKMISPEKIWTST